MTDRQTDGQTEKWAQGRFPTLKIYEGQTDSQTLRQTGRQTDRQTEKQAEGRLPTLKL